MEVAILVLIQVLVVIALSRLMGIGCRLIKQPLVIGEIIAGIMLGPSLLGLISPGISEFLFPVSTLPFLNVLSNIGLIFFMFLIGLELNPKNLKGKLNVAILISHVSIVVPFCLGSILSILLYPLVSNNTVPFTAFTLFLGAAMSITAFPVLARILTENNLQGTKLGTLALSCAAVDDVTAWCLLALAIAVVRTKSIVGAFPTILASIVYIALMVTVGRWFLKKLVCHYRRRGKLPQLVLAEIYMAVVISALITDFIGIHLIFGAFLLGAVMPKDEEVVKEITEKTEDFVSIFLLPVFFAYSGLRTQIGLLDRPETWLLCGAVIAVAIVGKYVGTYFAARVSGIKNREASALGWLMNTRGLTELIVLNIGLSLGVISPLLFTMLVIMALATTIMTSPLLELTYPKAKMRSETVEETAEEELEKTHPAYRILVPVANPNTQKSLLDLAVAIAGNSDSIINPLSLIERQEDSRFDTTPDEAQRLIQERKEALKLLIRTIQPRSMRDRIFPLVRISNDAIRETANIASAESANLIVVGLHHFTFGMNRLGGRVGDILNFSPVDVAVFLDNRQQQLNSLLVAHFDNTDDNLALSLALRLLAHDRYRYLRVLHFSNTQEETNDLSYELRNMLECLPSSVRSRVEIVQSQDPDPINITVRESRNVDLTIVSTSPSWGIEHQTLGHYSDRLSQECQSSLLITRRYSGVTSHTSSLVDSEQNSVGVR